MKWRYYAAKRRRHAEFYGPEWATTPTGRVTVNLSRKPAPAWNGLKPSLVVIDDIINTHADYTAIEQRILATMSMSRDRVRFVLDTYTDEATREAFRQAFGVPLIPVSGPLTNITVVCRPSQFARFLIYRNDNGGKNSFKELKPELFKPEPVLRHIDVSGNPAS